LRTAMPSWKTLTFRVGSEWAPDAYFGLDALQLRTDGTFEFEHRQRGEAQMATGAVAPVVLREVEQWLRAAGFPAVPPHDIPPGSGLVELVVADRSRSQVALMHYYAALKFPGYGDLVRSLVAWTAWLREGGDADKAPPGFTRA
jgi:hypothetical protein